MKAKCLIVCSVGLVLLTAFSEPVKGQVILSPNKLLFHSFVGRACPPQTVSLSNAGTSTVTIGSITLSGSRDFLLTNSCGSKLAPGQSCAITVEVTASQAGTFTGLLSVTDSAPNSPQTALLKVVVKGS